VLEFYEDKRLGMPRAASIPPSKPVHPRWRCGHAEPWSASAGESMIPQGPTNCPRSP